MAAAAAQAVRAWVNAQGPLVGQGGPLELGAFLDGRQPASPASGAYALLNRVPGQVGVTVVAEAGNPSIARVTAQVFAGTIEAAETAAVALAAAWQQLTGLPQPCPGTGVTILSAGNFSDPSYVPMPGSGGETFCFTTSADFMLLTT